MPILIKSSKGQRSCQLLTNGTPKQTNTLEEIIEALKGLTFKFEIRIADILEPDHSGGEVESQRTTFTSDVKKEVLHETEANTLPKVSKPQTKLIRGEPDHSREEVESQRTTFASDVKNEVLHETEANPSPMVSKPQTKLVHREPDHTREEVESQRTTFTSDDKKEVLHEPEANTLHKVSKPQTKLVRGKLEIGKVRTNCCIAVNDKCNPPVPYISYDDEKLFTLMTLIDGLAGEIESAPPVRALNVGDIVLAKSLDDNKWYRAIIEEVDGDSVHVYFFDWGLREKVTLARTRYLYNPDIGMSEYPACALKLRFVNTTTDKINKALTCETVFRMEVKAYDDTTECYEVEILDTLS